MDHDLSTDTEVHHVGKEPRAGLLGLPFPVSQLALIALIGIFAAAMGALLTTNSGNRFQSRSTLLIDQPLAIAAGDGDAPLVKLEHLRSKYGPLLSTTALAKPIAEDMHMTPLAVSRSIRAVPRGSSLLLDVYGESTSRATARKLADTAAVNLIRFAADEQARNNIPEPRRFKFVSVDAARTGVKISRGSGRAITVAIVVGLLAALAAAVVIYILGVGQKT